MSLSQLPEDSRRNTKKHHHLTCLSQDTEQLPFQHILYFFDDWKMICHLSSEGPAPPVVFDEPRSLADDDGMSYSKSVSTSPYSHSTIVANFWIPTEKVSLFFTLFTRWVSDEKKCSMRADCLNCRQSHTHKRHCKTCVRVAVEWSWNEKVDEERRKKCNSKKNRHEARKLSTRVFCCRLLAGVRRKVAR